jgi:hypothetical protein
MAARLGDCSGESGFLSADILALHPRNFRREQR